MISIIVAVYNIASVIRYCVDSILNQTDGNWELILVDDGSTDDCLEICKSYSEHDSRIRVVSKKNGGLSSARNAGIDVAKGTWVMFVDGDDYLLPDAIERLQECLGLLGGDIDFIQYGFQETDSYDVNSVKQTFSPNIEIVTNRQEMFERMLSIGGEAASMCTKLIKASLFNDLRFQEGIIHEDEQLTPKLLFKCQKVSYIQYKLYIYVKRNNSIITSRFNKKRLDIIGVMNERFELMERNELKELIPSFKLKYIQSLIILFMAAAAVRDVSSKKKLLQEVKSQLKSFDFSKVSLSLRYKLKLITIRYNIPILQLEAIIRRKLHKEIKCK